jgi:hypothetical protein
MVRVSRNVAVKKNGLRVPHGREEAEECTKESLPASVQKQRASDHTRAMLQVK